MIRTIPLTYNQMWRIMEQARISNQMWASYVHENYHGRLVFVGDQHIDDGSLVSLGECTSDYAIEFQSDRHAIEYMLKYR